MDQEQVLGRAPWEDSPSSHSHPRPIPGDAAEEGGLSLSYATVNSITLFVIKHTLAIPHYTHFAWHCTKITPAFIYTKKAVWVG